MTLTVRVDSAFRMQTKEWARESVDRLARKMTSDGGCSVRSDPCLSFLRAVSPPLEHARLRRRAYAHVRANRRASSPLGRPPPSFVRPPSGRAFPRALHASASSSRDAPGAMVAPFVDHSSQSNYPAVKVTHADFDVSVDFERKESRARSSCARRSGTRPRTARPRHARSRHRVVRGGRRGRRVRGPVRASPGDGRRARREAREVVPRGRDALGADRVQHVAVELRGAVAPPRADRRGSHPYLFTQCQAIHARALLPVPGHPRGEADVRREGHRPRPAHGADVRHPDRVESIPGTSRTTFAFEQKVPIPPYLLALAVGNLESRTPSALGARCGASRRRWRPGRSSSRRRRISSPRPSASPGRTSGGGTTCCCSRRRSRTAGWRTRA